jgi:hypothetical protein
MADAHLPGYQPDPNFFTYPSDSTSGHSMDSSTITGGEGISGKFHHSNPFGSHKVSINDQISNFVRSSTYLHALAKKLKFLTDDTQSGVLGNSCEKLAGKTEAAARAYAFNNGFNFSAVPPHEAVFDPKKAVISSETSGKEGMDLAKSEAKTAASSGAGDGAKEEVPEADAGGGKDDSGDGKGDQDVGTKEAGFSEISISHLEFMSRKKLSFI